MKYTRTELDRAIKKVEISIDKMIDLQDMGFGTVLIQEALGKLNQILFRLNNTRPR